MFERIRRKEVDEVNDQSVPEGELDICAYMQSVWGRWQNNISGIVKVHIYLRNIFSNIWIEAVLAQTFVKDN